MDATSTALAVAGAHDFAEFPSAGEGYEHQLAADRDWEAPGAQYEYADLDLLWDEFPSGAARYDVAREGLGC